MRINVSNIAEEGLSFDIKEDGERLIELASESVAEEAGEEAQVGSRVALDYSFLTPITLHLEVSLIGKDLRVDGQCSVDLSLTCSRCLRNFSFHVESSFTYFSFSEEAEDEEGGDAGVMELTHLEGDELNVTGLILEQVTLDLPSKPLCNTMCKGLCKSCGEDLNEGSCGCDISERIDPRFAKLEGFKIKE